MKVRITTLITAAFVAFTTTSALLADTYTVTNTNDTLTAGTLRQAITDANAHANSLNPGSVPDRIHFSIPGNGPHTISPTSGLPTITDPVVIDGYTQGDSTGTTTDDALENTNPVGQGLNTIIKIELNGSAVGSSGLTITAGSSTIRGLAINRFAQQGILLQTAGGNTIEGCFIGTNVTGTSVLQNGFSGIYAGSSNNMIGGTTPAARNLSSGNFFHGVEISVNTTTGNQVQGNLLGTNAAGTASLSGTTSFGVFITNGANTNVIGGTATGAGNVVSGNILTGVQLRDTFGNRIEGNFIGTNAAGTGALGNAGDGVGVENSRDNTVGGTAAGAGNLISGNGDDDDEDGVAIYGSGSTGNLVQGNFVGTDVSGTQALPNNTEGVSVGSGASSNTVGGTAVGAGNLISGNSGDGLAIYEGGTLNKVEGNFIGTDLNGTAGLGNVDNGVSVGTDCTNNTIGGTAAGARNLISGNGDQGIVFYDGASSNKVEGNYIGTDVTGTVDLGNISDGVLLVEGSSSNTIGGTTASARNIISGNGDGGVVIVEGSTGNLVQGNFIGTDVTGALDLGNTLSGVYLEDAPSNTIGGTAAGAGNVISGNEEDGVNIFGAPAQGNQISGNLIGRNAANNGPLGNGGHGVHLESSGPNVIGGGFNPNNANTIAHNGGAGVAVVFGTGPCIKKGIISNSIFSNGGLGIDLENDGVTPNDVGDGDTGANTLQNFPVLTSASTGGGSTTINGSLNSTASTSFHIEFFASTAVDPTGYGEGQTFLGYIDVMTDSGGNVLFSAALPVLPPAGQMIITSTTSDNAELANTSEFSRAIQIAGSTDQLLNISTRLRVLTGDNVLIGGFIITGSEPKKVMVRALGPSLNVNNVPVPGKLEDPTLTLHRQSDGAAIAFNDNWGDAPEPERTEIENGGLRPDHILESAMIRTLDPGAYTAIVRGQGGTTGIGLVEAYDLNPAGNSRLANLSTRGFVETGDNVMIGGVIIGGGGGGGVKVVVRALGPSLNVNNVPVPGRMADPTLQLVNENGDVLIGNDNWKTSQQAEIQATGLAPSDDFESAIVTILPVGPTTAILRGKSDTTGVALVEVFNVP